MRVILLAGLFAAAFGGSAFAQSGYVHHNFCLKHGGSQDCAYETMAQCQAAMKGDTTSSCVANSAPQNH